MPDVDKSVETLLKRIRAGEELKKDWLATFRVKECYRYWRGDQLIFPFDEYGNRRVQINKIHAQVREQIPSLYYFRPFARISAEPEEADTPGSELEKDTQLLQDTANHLVRSKDTGFRFSTHMALKESMWGIGVCEVGYENNFGDAPNAPKPPLKEGEKTDLPPVKKDPDRFAHLEGIEDPEELALELKKMKKGLKEKFYVKHISYKNFICSDSDKPNLMDNDWVGYWEEMSVEDIKKVPGWDVPKSFKAHYTDKNQEERKASYREETGAEETAKIYKIWDLRTKTRYVLADGHKKFLKVKAFKRNPLKVLRFDIDPESFWPIPPIVHKLPVQDEYNDSREYLRKVREATKPRYTYDEDAIPPTQMRKLEKGDIGTYIPRKGNTSNVIEAVNQPSYSGDALNTLTLSDKEFMDVSGVGGDSRVAQTKTATQAKIAEVKEQTQDSFDRSIVADFLSEIIKELVILSVENMNLDKFIHANIDQASMYADQAAMEIAESYQRINGAMLADAANGMNWDVIVDVENLSPVSQEEKFAKLNQALAYITNPASAMVFAAVPELLDEVLEGMGIRSAKKKELIFKGLQSVAQQQMQMAQQGMNPGNAPGQSGQAAPQQPQGQPNPSGPQPAGE